MNPDDVHLSVIVPIHDKAGTLAMFVEWLRAGLEAGSLHQAIFVLDHCSDSSGSVLDRYLGPIAGDRLTVVYRTIPPASAARARNLGLTLATGTHCFFLDPDVVGPDSYFDTLRSHVAAHHMDVVLCELLANGTSEEIWPLVAREHRVSATLQRPQLVEWARREPSLADIRTDALSRDSSSMSHLAAPWAVAWSSAIVIPRERALAHRFSEDLDGKGSEDLELAYRLWAVGMMFSMLREPLLHLPHTRNRGLEEWRDRHHERRMLGMHPTMPMEALCAFDGANASPMLSLMSRVDSSIVEFISEQQFPVAQLEALALPSSVSMVVGSQSAGLLRSLRPRMTVCPHAAATSSCLPLFGFSLPFESRSFASVLLAGIWQLVPERLACRMFEEALRVADSVYLLKDTRLYRRAPNWSQADVQAHDTPYWSRTHRISTNFHDYEARQIGELGSLSSFKLLPAERQTGRAT